MGIEPCEDGTTTNMRVFRDFTDDKSRLARIDHELRAAERSLTNAADMVEFHGGDPALLRQDAKIVRDHAAQIRNWRKPR